jgi:hypothetical protein
MSLMIFHWDEDEAGNEGWLAQGYPNFNVTFAGNFAHDVIEHFPRGLKHGPIADEAMALGARMHVRLDSGWWFAKSFMVTPAQTFAYEIHTLMREILDGGAEAPPTITEPPIDGHMEDEIVEAVRQAVERTNSDIDNGDMHADEPYTEQSIEFVNIAAWMRRGYRACIERFKGRNPADIIWLGECLDKETEQYKHGEYGDKLYVRIHEKDMECSVRRVSLYNYD